MSTPLKAVIFDLDGLAVDSEPYHVQAWYQAVAELGGELKEELLAYGFGRSVKETAEMIAKEYGVDAEALVELRNKLFDALTEGGIPPREGLVAAVESLRKMGMAVALASSGTSQYVSKVTKQLSVHYGISFDYIVTRDDVTRGKPDPEPFLAAARGVGIEAAYCAVLEDAPTGALAARRAAMTCIVVPNEHTRNLEFPGGCIIVSTLTEAVSYIATINATTAQ